AGIKDGGGIVVEDVRNVLQNAPVRPFNRAEQGKVSRDALPATEANLIGQSDVAVDTDCGTTERRSNGSHKQQGVRCEKLVTGKIRAHSRSVAKGNFCG